MGLIQVLEPGGESCQRERVTVRHADGFLSTSFKSNIKVRLQLLKETCGVWRVWGGELGALLLSQPDQ
jgi:hypothetical protein